MKKILALVMVVAMLACFATATSAAEAEFVEVKSFDFSNTDGLKGYTANWTADGTFNGVPADMTANVVDGKLVTGNGAFVVDTAIDGTNGVKITLDVVFDSTQVADGDQPWNWDLVNVVSTKGVKDDVLALSGDLALPEGFGGYYCHMKNNASHIQFREMVFNGTNNSGEWGGDPAENLENGQTYAVEFTVLPAEEGATVTFKVDGVDVALPNNPAITNNLSDEMLVFIGGTIYGDMPKGVQIDNVVISTMQEVTEDAPQTGFATIALAIVAIGSGAYIVSKKH